MLETDCHPTATAQTALSAGRQPLRPKPCYPPGPRFPPRRPRRPEPVCPALPILSGWTGQTVRIDIFSLHQRQGLAVTQIRPGPSIHTSRNIRLGLSAPIHTAQRRHWPSISLSITGLSRQNPINEAYIPAASYTIFRPDSPATGVEPHILTAHLAFWHLPSRPRPPGRPMLQHLGAGRGQQALLARPDMAPVRSQRQTPVRQSPGGRGYGININQPC